MELVVKHYSELTADELYDILHVRVLVFVVEQKCPYKEVDGRDRQAYHATRPASRRISACSTGAFRLRRCPSAAC